MGQQPLKRTLLIVIGLLVTITALIWGMTVYHFSGHAVLAEGEVIKLNAGGAHPQIQFTANNGQIIEYPQGGLIYGYLIGDRVRVLYDPQSPRNASIDSFGALWGFPVLFLIMGLICILVGLL